MNLNGGVPTVVFHLFVGIPLNLMWRCPIFNILLLFSMKARSAMIYGVSSAIPVSFLFYKQKKRFPFNVGSLTICYILIGIRISRVPCPACIPRHVRNRCSQKNQGLFQTFPSNYRKGTREFIISAYVEH